GSEALEIALNEHPDLIIADLLMPVMDGYEFARRLRADPHTAQTPLIFYTATYIQTEARALADICGAFRLLSKPSEPELILETVEAALTGTPVSLIPIDDTLFDIKHQKLLNDELIQKVAELENE